MKFKGMSRSHLFLIELTVVILFFAFASVISLQVFSKAYDIGNDTTALNGAIMAVQTAAETDKNTPFQDLTISQEATYFNKDWEIASLSDATYVMTSAVELEEKWAGTMAVFDYTVSSENEIVYQLQTKKYYSGETTSSSSPSEVD